MNSAARRAAKRRAPKHPAGPEAILRLSFARILRAQHARIKHAILAHARAPPKRADDAAQTVPAPPGGYAALVAALQRQFTNAALVEYGRTAVGPLLRVDVPGSPCVCIIAGQHGDEQAGLHMFARYGARLVDRARSLGVGLRVYPCVNPEAYDRGRRRDFERDTHANNFVEYLVGGRWVGELAPGTMPEGERRPKQAPETAALYDDLAGAGPFAALLDLHQDAILSAGEVFGYVNAGSRATWAHILRLAGKPFARRALENESWSDVPLSTDAQGLTALRDGSVTDWAASVDVPWSLCLEAPVEPLASAIRIHRAVTFGLLAVVAGRVRRDAATDPLDAPTRSVFAALANESRHLLRASPFRRLVDTAAKRTARSANEQTAKALDLDEHDPPLPVNAFTDGIMDGMGDFLDAGIDRAEDVFGEWDGEDEDELAAQIDEGLDGIMGSAVAWAGMKFARMFGEFIAASQQEAGVGQYVWLSTLDSHVRPEHAALDGQLCDWDDPPLKAEDSSLGIDCHAGEDAQCRCSASPVPPEGGLMG